jgi:ACR3 family arsenite efflux pump ArsB
MHTLLTKINFSQVIITQICIEIFYLTIIYKPLHNVNIQNISYAIAKPKILNLFLIVAFFTV